ncbi:uncharacterized protein LOC121384754 [Gigantopelta aegis]|uniref:uncharacterized protein LOC121384754 n=1 Tax=Gigantopelta aegis TaxID=1735272 RepID=UPI001B88B848|nr:uncharacterized protein LOC121384754 [Gigantopelta aegis]
MVWHDIEWTITVLLGVSVVVGPMFGSEVAVLMLFGLALLNLLVLLVFASLYISRDLSFTISEFLFFVLWYPISSLSSLPFDTLIDGPQQEQVRPPNLHCGVSVSIRQALFILSLFGLHNDHVVLLSVSWFIGFRLFLSSLAHSVTVYEDRASGSNVPHSDQLGMRPRNLPFIAAELMFAIFSLGFYYRLYSFFEIAAAMTYFIVSDKRLQRFITKQMAQCQLDFLEGLEINYFLGVLILIDCALCCVLFACAMRRGDYLSVILSYSNGFISLLEFRTRVWKRIQTEQQTLEDSRRASAGELADHNDICPVCLCVMTSARVTRCGHMFHGKCLRLSLHASPACPVCKEKLPERKSASALLLSNMT